MFVIAYVLLASNIGYIEPSWLRGDLFLLVLLILAIVEGSLMAAELVFRAMALFAWESSTVDLPKPHCSYCCPVKERNTDLSYP